MTGRIDFHRIVIPALVLTFFFSFLAFAKTEVSRQNSEEIFKQPLTLRFNKVELGKALEKISESSDIEIIYDKNISQKQVSGIFEGVPLETVIQRLLRGTNNSLIYQDSDNTLFIKGFGESEYISTSLNSGNTPFDDAGLSYKELNNHLDRRVRAFNEQLQDKTAFVDEFDMNRGELDSKLNSQIAAYSRRQNDDDTPLPHMGTTVKKHRLKAQRQIESYKQNLDSGANVLPGINSKEHRRIIEKQTSAFSRNLESGDEYLPEFGITRKEQKDLYKRQVEEFEKELTR